MEETENNSYRTIVKFPVDANLYRQKKKKDGNNKLLWTTKNSVSIKFLQWTDSEAYGLVAFSKGTKDCVLNGLITANLPSATLHDDSDKVAIFRFVDQSAYKNFSRIFQMHFEFQEDAEYFVNKFNRFKTMAKHQVDAPVFHDTQQDTQNFPEEPKKPYGDNRGQC